MALPRVLIQQASQMRRKLRNPQHPFYVAAPPYGLAPFFIAPVMPGETMKNLMIQAKVVSRPVKSKMVGWWTEFYFFYVKLRDLDQREEFTKMLLDPAWSPANVDAIAPPPWSTTHYAAGPGDAGQIDWVQHCRDTVIDEYFRDEGENSLSHYIVDPLNKLGAWCVAQINGNSVLDSCYQNTAVVAEDVAITVGADDQIRASEIELAMRHWEMLKQANLTTLSYEDFLAQYGIQPKPEEVHRPELIRYVRDWTYPTNTVDPATGKPTSACVWSIGERADKDRFFREPGFLFGLWCSRPKVYIGAQKGTFTGSLNSTYTWMPPGSGIDPNVSMKLVADNVGPLPTLSDAGGYWFDVKDLYLYGEQFLGVDLSNAELAANVPRISLPTADLANRRYITGWADAAAWFVDGTLPVLEVDGMVSLQIASTIRETTPQGGPATDL